MTKEESQIIEPESKIEVIEISSNEIENNTKDD